MEYVSAVRLAGTHARAYARDVTPLAVEAAWAFSDFVVAAVRLIAVLVRPAFLAAGALRRAASGPARAAGVLAWDYFSSQTPEALALEAAAGVALVAVALLEARFGLLRTAWRALDGSFRAVASSYRRMKRDVRQKSRVAAGALAHGLFFVPVGALFAWHGTYVHVLVQKYYLLPFSFLIPAARTCAALYQMSDNIEDFEREEDHFRGTVPGTPGSLRRRKRGESLIDSVDDEDRFITPSNTNAPDDDRYRENDLDEPFESVHDTGTDQRETPRSTILADSSTEKSSRWSVLRRRRVPHSPQPVTALVPADVNERFVSRTPSPGALERVSQVREPKLLRFWAISGVSWAFRSLVQFFAPGLFYPVLVRIDTFMFFYTVWLYIGLTRGADLFFPVLASVMRQSQYLRSNASAGADQLNVILRILVSLGILQASRAAVISSSLTESGVALLGVIFFVTPRPATFLGTILTGHAVPIYLTSYAATPASMPRARQTWLSYWVVYTLLEMSYSYVLSGLDWLPLWYHTKLALILWLQVPYYRGACVVLDAGMARLGGALSRYSRKQVSPRKRRVD